ncbi:MAG: DUF4339 domain-containing protein [Planctomycetota bacterium]
MATQWYWREGEGANGPVSFQELAAMVRDHVLNEDDLVRPHYYPDWQTADSVVGLFYMAKRIPVAKLTVEKPNSEATICEETPTDSPRVGTRTYLLDSLTTKQVADAMEGAANISTRRENLPGEVWTAGEVVIGQSNPNKTATASGFAVDGNGAPAGSPFDPAWLPGLGAEGTPSQLRSAIIAAVEQYDQRIATLQPAKHSGFVSTGVSAFFFELSGRVAATAGHVSRFGTSHGVKVIGAVLTIILVGWLCKDLDLSSAGDDRAFDGLSAALVRLENLQPLDASSTQWDAFETETRKWLPPTLDALEKSARRNPISGGGWLGSRRNGSLARRQLLYAGRSLRKMVAQRAASETQVNEFAATLSKAQSYLAGTEPTHSVSSQTRIVSSSGGQLGTLTIAILVVDAILIVAGGVYWWRRPRSIAS